MNGTPRRKSNRRREDPRRDQNCQGGVEGKVRQMRQVRKGEEKTHDFFEIRDAWRGGERRTRRRQCEKESTQVASVSGREVKSEKNKPQRTVLRNTNRSAQEGTMRDERKESQRGRHRRSQRRVKKDQRDAVDSHRGRSGHRPAANHSSQTEGGRGRKEHSCERKKIVTQSRHLGLH